MIRLEMTEGTSNKFWEIELSGKSFTTRWGRIGTKGQEKTQSFASPAAALREQTKLVASKRNKGYCEPASKPAPSAATPRNPALEAAIRGDREDAGAYQVYADWLQANGSPIGELIILEQALAKTKHPTKQRRASEIRGALALPAEDLATFGWRCGMWRWIRLENSADWMDNAFDALAVARPLFESPLCAALEELRIGVLRWEFNHKDVPAVLAAAGKQAWAADLQRLHLGDVDDSVDMAHHVIGDVGKVISKAFPGLVWLKLHSGDQTWEGPKTFEIGGLDLPELTTLVIETCAMSKKRLKHVLEAKLPKLDTLELWFGGDDANSGPKDVQPLLDGKLFPTLRHLGLRNCKFADELAAALPASSIAKRLESLDLSMGTMSDDGATALAGGARSFPKLKTLSIDDNFLDDAVRTVKAAFKGVKVVSKEQKEPDDSIEGEIHRFVSVHE